MTRKPRSLWHAHRSRAPRGQVPTKLQSRGTCHFSLDRDRPQQRPSPSSVGASYAGAASGIERTRDAKGSTGQHAGHACLSSLAGMESRLHTPSTLQPEEVNTLRASVRVSRHPASSASWAGSLTKIGDAWRAIYGGHVRKDWSGRTSTSRPAFESQAVPDTLRPLLVGKVAKKRRSSC